MPVKAQVTGRPLAGDVESLTCDPAIVLLRGPERQLAQTDLLYTETVDLEGRQTSFKKRCRVLPPSNVWTPHIDPPEVHVEITIVQQTDSHVWKDVPVLALVESGLAAQTMLTPARVNITLTGRSETLKNLQQLKPRAFVDCAGLDPSLTYELPVRVHLPPGTPVTVAVDPPAVHIVINQPSQQSQEH
ncbi:MAG: hypothetical protein LC725_06355 [Lentisphaerae bacterium]|nr:hypothetical protein [Lentisphaerota bacterium]